MLGRGALGGGGRALRGRFLKTVRCLEVGWVGGEGLAAEFEGWVDG